MQKWISNIVLLLIILLKVSETHAQSEENILHQADSLYSMKKYAEAQQIYLNLYQKGYSTPASLLKMAFVHEGLGHLPQALFFLSTYYSQTEDSKAYDKIQVLTNAKNIKGYELTDWDRILMWVANRRANFNFAVVACGVVALIFSFLFRIKKWQLATRASASIAITSFILFILLVNMAHPQQRGVINRPTYLMSGPSVGANLLGIVNEGNQVPITGEEDVWLKIQWNKKEAFVKKNDVLM